MSAITGFNEQHIHANTKAEIREIYEQAIETFFNRPVEILNMGGAELIQEKNLNRKGLLLKSISVEGNRKFYEQAVKNSPANVDIVYGNIFEYVSTGSEDVIIFDTTSAIVDNSINQILNFLSANKFKKKTMFILNLVKNARNGELSYDQIYKLNYKYRGIIEQISYAIMNNVVNIVEDVRLIEYKNKSKGMPMISYIFKLDVM